jgi:hypothetical protein
VRGVLLSLLATLVGLAMVGGGIWGLVGDVSDDDDSDAAAAQPKLPETSSAAECATVAKRDERYEFPHDLTFGPYGKATVKCNGSTVTFTIDINGLKSGTFYDVVLEKGKREEEVGSVLAVGGGNTVTTVTVGPEVDLDRYDFLTVRESEFGKPPSSATTGQAPELETGPFSAAL